MSSACSERTRHSHVQRRAPSRVLGLDVRANHHQCVHHLHLRMLARPVQRRHLIRVACVHVRAQLHQRPRRLRVPAGGNRERYALG
jgi:hypothetical protein